MVILYFILLILILWGGQYTRFRHDYLSLKSTNAIKGIFAVLILYSHLSSYLNLSTNPFNTRFIDVNSYIAQLMVAPFLFYSGYGIMLSVTKKPNYVGTFFKNRILKILVHFDIAVLCFILLQLCLGKVYSRGEYILSWIGWFSVGNSNWFIFDILALYTISWIVLLCHTHVKRIGHHSIVFFNLLMVVILWLALYRLKPGMHWWIDTLLTYPFGMLYALHKDAIDKKLHDGKAYFFTLTCLVAFFVVWHYSLWVDQYGFCSCIFCVLITVLTMRFRFDNKVLQWLGTYAFAIYIMQRWPMLIFVHYGLNANIPLFVCLSIPSAVVVAYIFQSLLNKLDQRFFVKK